MLYYHILKLSISTSFDRHAHLTVSKVGCSKAWIFRHLLRNGFLGTHLTDNKIFFIDMSAWKCAWATRLYVILIICQLCNSKTQPIKVGDLNAEMEIFLVPNIESLITLIVSRFVFSKNLKKFKLFLHYFHMQQPRKNGKQVKLLCTPKALYLIRCSLWINWLRGNSQRTSG